jgi:hypothetical protein
VWKESRNKSLKCSWDVMTVLANFIFWPILEAKYESFFPRKRSREKDLNFPQGCTVFIADSEYLIMTPIEIETFLPDIWQKLVKKIWTSPFATSIYQIFDSGQCFFLDIITPFCTAWKTPSNYTKTNLAVYLYSPTCQMIPENNSCNYDIRDYMNYYFSYIFLYHFVALEKFYRIMWKSAWSTGEKYLLTIIFWL